MRFVGLALLLSFISVPAWACTGPEGVEGQIIYNKKWKTMQFCDGDVWRGMNGGGDMAGVAPTGAVMAFDLATCPTGWTAYAPAQGRVVRGIDPTGTVDPSGVRVAGNLQEDEVKEHGLHTNSLVSNAGTVAGGSHYGYNRLTYDLRYGNGLFGGAETRMKNVALLYCRKD